MGERSSSWTGQSSHGPEPELFRMPSTSVEDMSVGNTGLGMFTYNSRSFLGGNLQASDPSNAMEYAYHSAGTPAPHLPYQHNHPFPEDYTYMPPTSYADGAESGYDVPVAAASHTPAPQLSTSVPVTSSLDYPQFSTPRRTGSFDHSSFGGNRLMGQNAKASQSDPTLRVASQKFPQAKHEYSITPHHKVQQDVPVIVTEADIPRTPSMSGIEYTPIYSQSEALVPMCNLSYEWIQSSCGVSQPTIAASIQSTPTLLQDPFHFDHPSTRRTSISSCASGPSFTTYGTPVSTAHDNFFGTPLSQAWTPQTQSNSSANMSPRSPRWSQPQRRVPASLNARSAHWRNKDTNVGRARGATVPSRGKPSLERGISEGHLPQGGQFTGLEFRSFGSRARSRTGAQQPPSYETADSSIPSTQPQQQRALPFFNTLFEPPGESEMQSSCQSELAVTIPAVTYAEFAPSDFQTQQYPYSHLVQNPYQMASVQPGQTPFVSQVFQQISSPVDEPTSPPAEDKHSIELTTLHQSPTFDGDVYTPRWKRRNAAGRWEGYCGHCTPGRWLDMKNSRYWEDKMRNHGICARTKIKFDDPVAVRWRDIEGNVVSDNGLGVNITGMGDTDGAKREGYCDKCGDWVVMDGIRGRGKGKKTGWWTHAYKCHEKGKPHSNLSDYSTEVDYEGQDY